MTYQCRNCGPTESKKTARGQECAKCGRLLCVPEPKASQPSYVPPPITTPTQPVPFVTATLTTIFLPSGFAPPELLCFYFGNNPAYRLTPLLYAHFHNACTSAMKRLGPEDATKLTEDLESVYLALLGSGIDPATIPQWSPELPPLPPVPETIDFATILTRGMLNPFSCEEHEPNDPDATVTDDTHLTPTPIPSRYDTRPTYTKRQAATKRPTNNDTNATLFD